MSPIVILLGGAAGIAALLLLRKKDDSMPPIGNSTTVHADGDDPPSIALQFVPKGAGFGWEPFEFAGTSSEQRRPVNGNLFWNQGSVRNIPPDSSTRYSWQGGLNVFTALPKGK